MSRVSPSTFRPRFALAALLAAVLTMMGAAAGCSASARQATTESPKASAAAGFPVTIEHAFGKTTIDAPPQRIVTWGWGATDAVLALGEVPVAIPKAAYGGEADGVLPWVREALTAQGAETPKLLDAATEDVPLEQVAALDADVFLAPYSGLTEKDYTKLTGLGVAVVAYPDQPWSTPWPDVITTIGKALGKSAEAEQVLSAIDQRIAGAAAAHPEFKGRSVAQVWDDGKSFYVYLPADPRVTFSVDLGLTSAPSVTTLDTKEASFYYTLSPENLDKLTSDVLVVYADSQQQLDDFLASKRAALLPQVKKGAVAPVIGASKVASVSPPTALSLTWGIDDYVDSLAKAVAKIG